MHILGTAAVEYALQGLTARADVRANNIANANTPNFRGSRVDFESALRQAVSTGRAPGAPEVRPDLAMPNANGSTVSLEGEMVGMLKDNLLREAMVNAFNHKANTMRTAIGGGR
jgi:flagellar basal-body rod protein FlgB